MTVSVVVPGISRKTFWMVYGCVIVGMIVYMAFMIKKSVYSYENPAVNMAISRKGIIDFPTIEVCSTDPTFQLDCNNLTGSCLCYPFPNIRGYPLRPNFDVDYDAYMPYYEEQSDYGTKRRRGGPRPADDDGFSPITDVEEIHDVIVEFMNAQKRPNMLEELVFGQPDGDDEEELNTMQRRILEEEKNRQRRLETARQTLKRIQTAAPAGYCHNWLNAEDDDYAPGVVPVIQLGPTNNKQNPLVQTFTSADINFAKWNDTQVPTRNVTTVEEGEDENSTSTSWEILTEPDGVCRFQFNVSNNLCIGKNPTNQTYIRFKFTNIPDFKQAVTGGDNVSVGDYGQVEVGADTYFYFIDGLASLDGGIDFENVFDFYPSATHLSIASNFDNFTAAYPNQYFPKGLIFTSRSQALTIFQNSKVFGGYSAEVYWTCDPPVEACQPGCDLSQIGDGVCNLECLSPACNTDTPFFSNEPSDCAAALAAVEQNGAGSCMDQKYNIVPSFTSPQSKCSKFNLPEKPFRLNSKQKKTNIVIANQSSIREASKQSNIRSKSAYVTVVLGGYTLKNPKPYSFQGYTFKVYHPMEQKRTGTKGNPNKGLKYALPVNFQTIVSVQQEEYIDLDGHRTFSYSASTTSAPMYVPEIAPPKPPKRGEKKTVQSVSPYYVPCSIPDGDPDKRCTTTVMKFQMSSFIIPTTTEYVAMDANAVVGALGGFWSLLAGVVAFLFPVVGFEQKRFIFDKSEPLPEDVYQEIESKKTWKDKLKEIVTLDFLGWNPVEESYLQAQGLSKSDLADKDKIKNSARKSEMVDLGKPAASSGSDL